jgi:hypothetical protein
MKKTLLFCVLLLVFNCKTKAQIENNIVNKMDSIKYQGQTEQYCLLVCTGKMFSTKINVDIDFGQTTSFFSQAKQRQITDETGNIKKFDSVIDALHFLNARGWIFVAAYPMSSSQGQCYHYLMKRALTKKDLAHNYFL